MKKRRDFKVHNALIKAWRHSPDYESMFRTVQQYMQQLGSVGRMPSECP